MNEVLKARFTKEQLGLAVEIGQSTNTITEKLSELFQMLGDPLLSIQDLAELLGIPENAALRSALDATVGDGTLEFSDETSRPLDKEGTRLYRRKGVPYSKLALLAQECQLDNQTSRYVFTCEGKLLRCLAKVDRLDAIAGTGNQRDEVKNHVGKIADGILNGTQVPNSVLLVVLEDMIFEGEAEDLPASFIRIQPLTDWIETVIPGTEAIVAQRVRSVQIEFPFRFAAFDDEKACLLVDGQQRTAALSMVDVEKVPQFFLSVNAVAASPETAKDVFRIANSTHKIQTQFSRALIASMESAPPHLREEQTRTVAARLLALEIKDSPFYQQVQYPGVSQKPRPQIVYNSLFSVLSEFADSALPLQNDSALLAKVVNKSYQLVVKSWPTAWNKKPTESRLTHGVGLRASAGLLVQKLEHFYAESNGDDILNNEIWKKLEDSLNRLKARIVWTDEEAAGAPTSVKKTFREQIASRQNTNQDITALTSFLKKESLDLDVTAKKSRG